MNRRTFSRKLSTGGGALALGLLLAAATASALTNSASVGETVAPANAASPATRGSPAQTTLMPVAPVSSRTSTSSEEDIREIRQPRHLSAPWFWAAVAAGIIALAVAAWRWIRHGKFFVMQPHELALQYLGEALGLMDPDHAREYCFEVSKIIRRYIEERFHIHAPQLTTEEFLREMMEVRETMLGSHRALLGDFLEHCDLAKFGGWCYCRPDLVAMHVSAVEFVRQTAASNKDVDRNDPTAIAHATTTINPAP